MMIEETEREKSNYQKEADCMRHKFEPIAGTIKYTCKNCGCELNAEFVAGYERGLEHGLIWAQELEDGN